MYKYHTTRFGTDAVEKLEELRKEFPSCHFARGIYKGKQGIYAFKSQDIKEYGDKWELDNGDVFFAPSPEQLQLLKTNLSQYKTEWTERLKVILMNGLVLEIFPASAIPKKVYFTKKVQSLDSPYQTDIPYGKLAYEMYDLSQQEKHMMLDDPRMVHFIKVALFNSYTLPEPLWDVLGIGFGDFDKIFAAAMGMDWGLLQEEIKKSNVPSQQEIGTAVKSAQTVGTST